MKKFRKNTKAASPVLTALMLTIVAFTASFVTYLWTMEYLGYTTTKVGRAIQIQSIALAGKDLKVYVKNIGQVTVKFDPTGCTYINGKLEKSAIIAPNTLQKGETATITIANQAALAGHIITVKVVSTDGTFMETKCIPS